MQSKTHFETSILFNQSPTNKKYFYNDKQIENQEIINEKQTFKILSNKITNNNPAILLRHKKIMNSQNIDSISNNINHNTIYKKTQLNKNDTPFNSNQINSSNLLKNYAEFPKNIKNYRKSLFYFNKEVKPLSVHQIHEKDSLYDKIIVKRTFGTAPLRKRIKTELDRENILNCEDLIDKKSLNKSKSTLFHSSELKIKANSQIKNRPTILYNSSKLPKDFFQKQNRHSQYNKFIENNNNKQNDKIHQFMNKNLQRNKSHQRVFSCPKIINKQISKINELQLNQVLKPNELKMKNCSINKVWNVFCQQQQFTFRKCSMNHKNRIEQSEKDSQKRVLNSKQNKQIDKNGFIHQLTTKDFLQVSPVNFSLTENKKKMQKIQNKTKKEVFLKL